ncbi:hypothetical protein [Bradyrhizobium sp. AC87j1]
MKTTVDGIQPDNVLSLLVECC